MRRRPFRQGPAGDGNATARYLSRAIGDASRYMTVQPNGKVLAMPTGSPASAYEGTFIPFCTAGRAEIASNQRLTPGNSASSVLCHS